MTKRTLAALCLALAYAGQSVAQTPDVEQGSQPQPVAEQPVEVSVSPVSPSFAPEHQYQACTGDAGVCCDAPGGRFWLTGEGVLGWVERSPIPTLATTSPAGTSQATAGILGLNTTSTLFGSDGVNGDARWGFKLGAGFWLNEERTFSIDAGFMMLESQSATFGANSNANPILARPYVDATTSNQQAVLVAFPGSSTGSIAAIATSGNYYDAHVDISGTLIGDNHFRLDGLVGYRFYRYGDGLRIGQTISPTSAGFTPGTEVDSVDQFSASNTFNGGELGLRTEFLWDNFSLGLLGKIAVGQVHRNIEIDGTQITTVPGSAPLVSSGGVYALSSNIGRYNSNDWTFLPEFGVNLAWQASCHVRFQLGYSVLMLEDVARAADQVDTTINPNLFPPPQTPATPNRPQFALDREEVLIQTFTFGVEFRF